MLSYVILAYRMTKVIASRITLYTIVVQPRLFIRRRLNRLESLRLRWRTPRKQNLQRVRMDHVKRFIHHMLQREDNMALQNFIAPPMRQAVTATDNATFLFWQNFRASLLKEAKDLQELRAAKLQQAAEIQRMLDTQKTET